MNAKNKSREYAEEIKAVIVQMAIDGKIDGDLNNLNTEEFEKILLPVFEVLTTIKTDGEMALDGTWDCDTIEGKEGFRCQIELINKL